jgi:uncharacterized protein (TIGR02001 family)
MRRSFIVLTLAGAAVAVPAQAQDTPTPKFDVSVGATVTSDYRFRGISQSNKRPAIQGTVGVTHESGLYAGTWASTISNYVAAGSDAEIDLYAGYKTTTAGGTTIDGGVLYYVYPNSDGATTNFFEPYFNVTTPLGGGATVKVGTNFAWKQKALSVGGPDKGAFYLYSDVSAPVGPVTVTGHVGRSFTKNYITFGTRYTDWSLTAAYTAGPATFSVGYVDTNKTLFSYPAGGGKNRNVSKAGIVASVGFAF